MRYRFYKSLAQRACSIHCFQGNHGGFTLLEVLVTLVLLGILIAVFGMGLVAAVQGYDFSRTNAHISQKAQLAMTRMRRELMELTDIRAISAPDEDAYVIYERLVPGATPYNMRFGIHHHRASGNVLLYTNLNDSVNILDDGTIAQGDVLVDGVNNLTLSYFSGLDVWSLDLMDNNIQHLSTISLTLSLSRPDRPGQTQDFDTRIHLRNNNNFGGVAPTTEPPSREDYTCFIRILSGDSSQ